jgi:hypothetical protein
MLLRHYRPHPFSRLDLPMNLIRGARFRRRALTIAAAVSATLLFTATAASATDDSFTVKTTDGCGAAEFVDYGPGAPGGGNNDDYILVHDYCADGHGVRAYVWILGEYWGDQYNGNGKAGAAVVWDPFKSWGPGNLTADTPFKVEVCLVDGPNDAVDEPEAGNKCRSYNAVSVDG